MLQTYIPLPTVLGQKRIGCLQSSTCCRTLTKDTKRQAATQQQSLLIATYAHTRNLRVQFRCPPPPLPGAHTVQQHSHTGIANEAVIPGVPNRLLSLMRR